LGTIIVPWAGIPGKTRSLLLDFPDIALHNLHYNAVPVAELALALLMAVAKKVIPFDQSLRAGDWNQRFLPSDVLLLAGKTALVLGYGAIGRRVADRCLGLGMVVKTIRRRPDSTVDDDRIAVYAPDMLHALLPETDVLMICLPQTSETVNLIDQKELDLLSDHAVLVNIARGAIVNEEALYKTLRDGGIFGAGLDVWYNYPRDEESRFHTLPANLPFHELQNVVMSPHRGDATSDTNQILAEHLAMLLNSAARGEELPNMVDLAAGY
jgi:phosphoglycerate dehydrogenase-like enzyme